MNLEEVNYIECKTTCVSRTEDREINQWGTANMQKNVTTPNFLTMWLKRVRLCNACITYPFLVLAKNIAEWK